MIEVQERGCRSFERRVFLAQHPHTSDKYSTSFLFFKLINVTVRAVNISVAFFFASIFFEKEPRPGVASLR